MIKYKKNLFEDTMINYNVYFASITMRGENSISKLLYTQYLNK